MTREEAIEFGNMWLELNEDAKDSSTYTFFQMAIKALEQEPILEARQRERQLEIEYQHGYDKGWEEGRKALEQQSSYNSVKTELDCISREEALRIAKSYYHAEYVVDRIRQLPSVTPKARWILCSERLPNEFADVLCNTDSEEIFIATYLGKMNDGTDCFDDNDGMMWEGNIIAWMPLPQPYTESEK